MNNIDIEGVTDMEEMLAGCESLTSIDVSKFETGSVSYMSGMFDSCKSLTSLDLTKLDTSWNRDFSYMFNNCEKLATLKISNAFISSNAYDLSFMFSGCSS